MVVIVSK